MRKILLLVFTLFLVGCAGIDRSLGSLNDAISSQDRVTGARTLNFYDRQDQIKKSDKVAKQLIQQKYIAKGKKINAALNRADYNRLMRIFGRIHSVSHMSDEKWSLILLPEKSFNAFVVGGTYIFVHQGLLRETKSDDEIAGVLAHEIAHVAANHVYESQAQNMAAMAAGSKSINNRAVQATYTHEKEIEADRIGVLYMALAGYDPYAPSRLWDRIFKKQGDVGARFSNHPINSERRVLTRQFADAYKKYYRAGKININHRQILASLRKTSGPAVGEGGGLSGLLETALGSVVQHQQAKVEVQRQAQRIRFLQSVQAALAVVGKQVTSNKGVVYTFKYSGNRALKELSMRAIASQDQVVSWYAGRVRPGQVFSLKFEFDAPVDFSNARVEVDHAAI